MADAGTVFITVKGDWDGFSRDVQQQGRGLTSKFSGIGKSLGQKLTAGASLAIAGAAGLGAVLGKQALDAASDVNEASSKVQVVFGKQAAAIEAFAQSSATNFGISKLAALDAAGTFGNLFRSLGISQDQASAFSQTIVGLASDLASFNNADPSEVLLALRSGLLGEAEPLRQFGVSLSEARIEAEALQTGIAKAPVDMAKLQTATVRLEEAQKSAAETAKKYGKDSLEARKAQAAVATATAGVQKAFAGQKVELTAAQKAQAAYSIILKDTKLAQGDFARTSGGLANQQRILAAQFENVKASIGRALLPVALRIAKFLNENVVPAFKRFADVVGKGGITAGIRLLVERFGDLSPQIKTIAIAAAALGVALFAAVAPVAAIVVALAALGAAIVLAWQRSETFRDTVTQVWESISEIVAGVLDVIITLWRNFGDNIVNFAKRAWGPIRQIVSGALEFIRGIVQTFSALLHGDWSEVWAGLGKIVHGAFNAVFGIIKAAFEQWRFIFGIGLEIIGSVFKGAFRGFVGIVKDAFNAIVRNVTGAWDKVFAATVGSLRSVRDFVVRIWEDIVGAVATAVGFIRGVFGGIWDGLTQGLVGVANWILDRVEQFVNGIIDLINGALDLIDKATGPFTTIGEIPHVSVPNIGGAGAPHVPAPAPVRRLAGGGLITGATFALIGEDPRTRPELVTPVSVLRSELARAMAHLPDEFADAIDRTGHGTLIVNQTLMGRDDRELAYRVAVETARARRSGRL